MIDNHFSKGVLPLDEATRFKLRSKSLFGLQFETAQLFAIRCVWTLPKSYLQQFSEYRLTSGVPDNMLFILHMDRSLCSNHYTELGHIKGMHSHVRAQLRHAQKLLPLLP